MTPQKEYPQGYGCIPGRWGHWECLLTDDALNKLSTMPKPEKSPLEIFMADDLRKKLLKTLEK